MKTGLFLLTENYGGAVSKTIHDDIELGVYAEELGFDEVWFAEHHFNGFSVIPSPSLMMATLAAKTDTIRIGSAAFLAPFYQSIRLAEEIAVLDNLSNGRIDAGFAKGGFTYDMELFEKAPDNLRDEMYLNINKIDENLSSNQYLQPKPIQKKIPFYIATFSTQETIKFAAKSGYGLMFSQGATLQECEEAQELYRSIAGFYPQMVVMRVFCLSENYEIAYKQALLVTDHFVKCMLALKAREKQPTYNEKNYKALLGQREQFFNGKKFLDAAILGDEKECIEQIKEIKKRIKNLHLVLKVAASEVEDVKRMLKLFSQNIKTKIEDVRC